MLKRALIICLSAIAIGAMLDTGDANAHIYRRRFAPVRRVVARAALPPYRVARRVVYGRPYYPVARPYYRAPVHYGPGVSVVVGF